MYIKHSWMVGESFILCCASDRTEHQNEHGRKLQVGARTQLLLAAQALCRCQQISTSSWEPFRIPSLSRAAALASNLGRGTGYSSCSSQTNVGTVLGLGPNRFLRRCFAIRHCRKSNPGQSVSSRLTDGAISGAHPRCVVLFYCSRVGVTIEGVSDWMLD
jgi:hypothetical protein